MSLMYFFQKRKILVSKGLLFLISVFSFCLISCQSSYDKAQKAFKLKNYEKAKKYILKISEKSKNVRDGNNLLETINHIEDSTNAYKDSTVFSNAKDAIAKENHEIALSILKDINTKYIRPSVYCDSSKLLKEICNIEISEKKEKIRINSIIEQLDREIKSLRNSKYKKKTTPAEIQMAIVLLGAYQKLIDDNKTERDKRIKSRIETLEYLVIQNRINVLPKMRKDYGRIMNNLMWEYDVSVSVFGSGYKILQLTGYVFASNKGIKLIQETLKDSPKLLRFKQVRYKWYKGSDKYTYYDVVKKSDSEPYRFK